MASLQDRIHALGWSPALGDRHLFEWVERASLLTFLAEKLLRGKSVKEVVRLLSKEERMNEDPADEEDTLKDVENEEALGLMRVLNFVGIPVKQEDVLGKGSKENRESIFLDLLEIVENLPANSLGAEDQPKKKGMEICREGLTANVALITTAIRARKGCLQPKIDPLPSHIHSQDSMGKTMEDVRNTLSDTLMRLDAARLDEQASRDSEKDPDDHEAFRNALSDVKNAMDVFDARVKHFIQEKSNFRKVGTHHTAVQGLGKQATAILKKYERVMEVTSSIRSIKALRDSIMPDKVENQHVNSIMSDAEESGKIAKEKCSIMEEALKRMRYERDAS